MVDSLVLIEGSSEINEAIYKITDDDKNKVISFDITAHNALSRLGIVHEKVENYIDINDQNLIDKLVIDKSHEWYKQEGVSDFLQFENLNLGSLLELEITPYFLLIMKNFVGIRRIIEKEKPLFISASPLLGSMVKIIDKNNNIVIQSHTAKMTAALILDRVAISINIGGKLFTIWVSRSLAIKIKNIIESLTNMIFNIKLNLHSVSNKKSIMLIDFNPMLHGHLLKELSRLDENVILLNERRPAVWNLQSLKNVRQCKCKVLRLKDFLNPKLQSIIINKQKELQIRIKEMSLNNKLEEYFSIADHSFWSSIKENFVSMCLERFNEAIERFELSKELFEKIDVACMLILYAVAPEEKVIIQVAQRFKIPGLILQHGVYPQIQNTERSRILFNIISFTGIKHALWGNETREYFLQLGVKNDDIILAGSSRHDEFFRMKNKCENNGTILLAYNYLPETYLGVDTNVFTKFDNILRDVCKISHSVPMKKLIVKLHPGQSIPYDPTHVIHDVNPSTPIYKTQNILDLMKDCDVLVSLGPSTILLEAMILGKPTITFAIDPQLYYEDKIFKSGATLLVKTPKDFEDALNNVLFNSEFRNELLQKGKKFVNEYLINQGNSSEFLASFINDHYL